MLTQRKSKSNILGIAAISLLGMLWGTIPAWAANTSGQIRGRLIKEGKPLVGHPVRLDIFERARNVQATQTFSSLRGEFAFRDLQTEKQISYVVHLEYEGIRYESSWQSFAPGVSNITLPPFKVFQATPHSDHITASERLVFEFGKPDLIKVTHRLIFENEGTLAFNPQHSQGKSITIQLLPNGFGFHFLKGLSQKNASINADQSLLVVNQVLFPGAAQRFETQFSYFVAYDNRSLSMSLPLSVKRKGIDLLISDTSLSVHTTALTQQPPISFQNRQVAVFSRGAVPANTTIAFTLRGLKREKDVGLRWLLVGLGLIAIWAFGTIWKVSRITPKQEVVRLMTQLKKDYESGHVSKTSFEKQNRALRELLFDFMS